MTCDWPAASPARQDRLSSGLDTYLGEYGAGINGVVVVQDGALLYEKYADPYHPAARHILNSCTKSFLSTLVGIAIDRGHIVGVDEPVVSYFPEWVIDDPRKQRITIGHLLSMASGIRWPQYGPDNISDRMTGSPNWVEFILAQPMAAEPGKHINYSNGDSHLIAAILHHATGDVLEFASTNLFAPLSIDDVRWDRDPQGINIGSATLYLRPRDMAKLGQLVLNHGHWNGTSVVSPKWLQQATSSHVKMPSNQLTDYGYYWWLYPDHGLIEAWGGAGQRIAIFPDRNVVVVITADRPDDAPRSTTADEIYRRVLHMGRVSRVMPHGGRAESSLPRQR